MAKLTNCEKCGRMFQTIGSIKLCSKCRETDDDMYKVVREFIYDNPGATVPEVAEATDVAEKKILEFLREGRLETIGENMLIECEKCGEPIKSGKMCDKCNRELTMGLKDMAQKMKADLTSNTREKKTIGKGMHTQYKKV